MARTTGCKTLLDQHLHLHLHQHLDLHPSPAPAPFTCTLHLHLDPLLSMRHFWALPAVLRIALANQHAFSVFDDLLAFPQVGCALRGVWCGMRC
jgi:hypothetical protein